MSIDETPRGSVRPIHKRHYNSLPKTSLEPALGACSVALWTANEGLFVHFTLRIPPKSTVGVLLVPLFGQFQKLDFSHSRRKEVGYARHRNLPKRGVECVPYRPR